MKTDRPPWGQVEDIKRDPQTYAIIGAAMEVHRRLGPGFLEAVYQEALAIELAFREIPFKREVTLPIKYRDQLLSCGYRVDFVCNGDIIVELKAIEHLANIHFAQTLNYLKATDFTRAVLLNFGEMSLTHRRIVDEF